jgi:MFS family permease
MQKMGAYCATIFISTLPFVSRLVHSSGNHIQLTLTVFFVGSIVGELLAGPVSRLIGCRHIFLLGAAFYLLSAAVIRYSSLPSLLMVARAVQALGALASISVTLYSFYTAAPILPLKVVTNPAGGFRHLFFVLTAGIVIGGLSTRMAELAFIICSLPAAITAFARPFLLRLANWTHATTFGAGLPLLKIGAEKDQPLFPLAREPVVQIYARRHCHPWE